MFTFSIPDKTYDLDAPDTEEEDPAKLQKKNILDTVTRGSNILNKVVATRNVDQKSAFSEQVNWNMNEDLLRRPKFEPFSKQ